MIASLWSLVHSSCSVRCVGHRSATAGRAVRSVSRSDASRRLSRAEVRGLLHLISVTSTMATVAALRRARVPGSRVSTTSSVDVRHRPEISLPITSRIAAHDDRCGEEGRPTERASAW